MASELGKGEGETGGVWLRCSFPLVSGGVFAAGEQGLADERSTRSVTVSARWDTKAAGPVQEAPRGEGACGQDCDTGQKQWELLRNRAWGQGLEGAG